MELCSREKHQNPMSGYLLENQTNMVKTGMLSGSNAMNVAGSLLVWVVGEEKRIKIISVLN